MEKVEALLYKHDVYDGVLNFSHGFSFEITEIFVPSEKICFNVVDGKLNVFGIDDARSKGISVLLDKDFVKNLKLLVSLRKKCKEKANKYFKGCEEC